jgi:hypothetical protein
MGLKKDLADKINDLSQKSKGPPVQSKEEKTESEAVFIREQRLTSYTTLQNEIREPIIRWELLYERADRLRERLATNIQECAR